MGVLKKQISALKLGIEVLKRERRTRFAAGEHAWKEGYRPDVIKDPVVSGTIFGFAEDGHKGWVQYTEAIQEFLDMIESLSDADAKVDPQPGLFDQEDGFTEKLETAAVDLAHAVYSLFDEVSRDHSIDLDCEQTLRQAYAQLSGVLEAEHGPETSDTDR